MEYGRNSIGIFCRPLVYFYNIYYNILYEVNLDRVINLVWPNYTGDNSKKSNLDSNAAQDVKNCMHCCIPEKEREKEARERAGTHR